MTARDDLDRQLDAYLRDGPTELPEPSYYAVRDRSEVTRQRAVIGPWRLPDMSKFVPIAVGAAAVVVALVIGSQVLGTPAPSTVGAAPSATVAPSPTPASVPEDGGLEPGTYLDHPLPAPNDALSVTFTVPTGWVALGNALIPAGDPDTGAPGGIAIQFLDVTTLNGDPCRWSGTGGDVNVGPAVDDLVDALVAQTAYEVSDPVGVTIGGYQGKRVDIVHPTEPFVGDSSDTPACDGGRYRVWNTSEHGEIGIYAQGPANRWQANILDADGTRLVIVTQDFPGTSPADRAEMDAIVDSIVIGP